MLPKIFLMPSNNWSLERKVREGAVKAPFFWPFDLVSRTWWNVKMVSVKSILISFLIFTSYPLTYANGDCIGRDLLGRCGIDTANIQKSIGQMRDECFNKARSLRAEIEFMGLAGKRCAALQRNISSDENVAVLLAEAGCSQYVKLNEELSRKQEECEKLNNEVGRLHRARYAHVEYQPIVASKTKKRTFDEVFRDAGCEKSWRERATGVKVEHYYAFRTDALNRVRREFKLEEIQEAGEAAIASRDTASFCAKYFPAPEMY